MAAELTTREKHELCARVGCGHPRFAHGAWGLDADDPCAGWSEDDECDAGGPGKCCEGFVSGSGAFCCEWEDAAAERYCSRTAGPSGRCEEHEVRDGRCPFVGLRFEGAKPHIVQRSLVPAIIADLAARGHAVTTRTGCASAAIDFGGIALAGEPIETFTVGRHVVHVRSHDTVTLLRAIEELEPRTFAGRQYFKIHGAYSAVVLGRGVMRRLVLAVRERAPEAEARAAAYWGAAAERAARKAEVRDA